MAINNVELTTTFDQWRVITNAIITAVGDNTALSTTEKSNLVGALNEVLTQLGTVASLNTTENSNVVGALNEVLSKLGTIESLTTTETGNAVGAINELDSEIGDLTDLDTDFTTNLVGAINELEAVISTIGDISTLTTTETSSIVGAINEIDSEITVINSELVGKTTSSNIPVINIETNHGRFSAETTRTLTTFDDSLIGMVEYNSSSFTEGEKFINDNSNSGGAGGTLGADILALVTSLGSAGRADLQNGYEFYILDITAGGGSADGQTVTSIDYYPVISGNDSFLGPIGSTITYQFWVRLETLATPANNGVVLADSSVTTYVNGTEITPDELLEVADGWVHVRQTAILTNEFKQFFPVIQANVGDVINIALPCMYQANVDNGIHVGVM